MTAKQILEFANEHARDSTEELFRLEQSLIQLGIDLTIKAEQEPYDTTLIKQIQDANEKLQMVILMKIQRLELFRQSSLKEID